MHLHDALLQRRNDVFAHNDTTPRREELDVAAHLGVISMRRLVSFRVTKD